VAELSEMEQVAAVDSDEFIDSLSIEQRLDLFFKWDAWRRPKQIPPEGNWRIWLLLAGRGFGKTRTGAEFIREQVDQGTCRHIALVAATAGDARDTMIEGESGLMRIFPPGQRPNYEPSKRRVTFYNGAMATAYTADEPDRLRGPNHDLAWADELASWRYPEAWDMLMLGLRIGINPKCVVTTTPKPTGIIRRLLNRDDGSVVVTRGSTYENRTNLAGSFLEEILARYEGTRLGRQELHAELLEDIEGALWNRTVIDNCRVTKPPEFTRVVVAVDPAASAHEESAETGIVVAALGSDGHGYVMDDVSLRGSPNEWGQAAIAAFHRNTADRIVAEANQGGDMVSHTLRTVDQTVPVKLVRASRGKQTRAEPVAALYEQGKVHHVGFFPTLEDQLCGWVPGFSASPDRLDALVWAFHELMVLSHQIPVVVPVSMEQTSPWTVS
jgi:phage terminase large subunit-like protein